MWTSEFGTPWSVPFRSALLLEYTAERRILLYIQSKSIIPDKWTVIPDTHVFVFRITYFEASPNGKIYRIGDRVDSTVYQIDFSDLD